MICIDIIVKYIVYAYLSACTVACELYVMRHEMSIMTLHYNAVAAYQHQNIYTLMHYVYVISICHAIANVSASTRPEIFSIGI